MPPTAATTSSVETVNGAVSDSGSSTADHSGGRGMIWLPPGR
jgi:hypothetical protein